MNWKKGCQGCDDNKGQSESQKQYVRTEVGNRMVPWRSREQAGQRSRRRMTCSHGRTWSEESKREGTTCERHQVREKSVQVLAGAGPSGKGRPVSTPRHGMGLVHPPPRPQPRASGMQSDAELTQQDEAAMPSAEYRKLCASLLGLGTIKSSPRSSLATGP